MKYFSIVTTGYQSGVYGWSGDWFALTVIDGDRTGWFRMFESYGGMQDYQAYLKDKGYKEIYTGSIYGRVTRKDVGGVKPDTMEDVTNFVEGKA